MRFMNEFEIEDAARQHLDDPILGPASWTLVNLVRATNANSDGWAYWPKPTRAAAKLMSLFDHPENVTAKDVKAAYVPIKAFLTRQGWHDKVEIVEVSA